ncbi:MAG: hypothetical protein ACUVQV_08470 [Dissulfurimicrobium sp.]|uniref:hypothetical protein n=1 Tax=Dissulfurimicrobium sp. TaxID=2022436 RepID=UPI0040498879
MADISPCLAAYSDPSTLYSDITRDFAPVPAMVIDVTGDTVTIDKGKAQGIAIGDLFEVYNKGLPVKDPTKKEEIIGYLKQPAAIIEVVHLEEQKAGCHILSGKTSVTPRLPATRYSDIPTACVVKNDLELAQKGCETLTHTLPNLIWLPPASVPSEILDARSMETLGVKMLFSFEADSLKVYGPGLNLIRQYPLEKGKKNKMISTQKVPDKTTVIAQDAIPEQHLHIDISDVTQIGRLPEKTLQVDVLDLDGDGRLEVIYLVPSGIYICPFRQSGPIESYKFYGPGHLIGFSALPKEGWLALNIAMDKVGMRSILFSYKNSHLIEVQNDINLWLAFLNMGDGGKTLSMVGQSFDQDTMFGQKFYMLKPEEKGILYTDTLRFPAQFSIMGAYWADLNGDGDNELIMVDTSGRLFIYNNLGQTVWSTAIPVIQSLTRQGFLKGCLVSNPNGSGLICLLFAGRDISNNEEVEDRLMLLAWQGGKYTLQTISQPLGGYVSGISNINGHIVLCLVRADSKKPEHHESIFYEIKIK